MNCFLIYISFRLENGGSSWYWEGVTLFTWCEPFNSREIYILANSALFHSHLQPRNSVKEVQWREAMESRGWGLWSTASLFLGISHCVPSHSTHCIWRGSRRHTWPWTSRFPVKVSTTGLPLIPDGLLCPPLACICACVQGRERQVVWPWEKLRLLLHSKRSTLLGDPYFLRESWKIKWKWILCHFILKTHLCLLTSLATQ